MKILSLDLGKYKTVGCDYERESGQHRFRASSTAPAALQQLVEEVKPDRVVIEVCNIAGWVCDLLRGMGVEVQVANTSDVHGFGDGAALLFVRWCGEDAALGNV